MPRPGEDLIQFIWKYRLIRPGSLLTTSGRRVTIIKPGEQNRDSGPDFFNALIELDGLSLAGNIEIHVRTSDWKRHGHESDAAYNNIILHAVYTHDVDLTQNMSHGVEVLELKEYIAPELIDNYAKLGATSVGLPCAAQLGSVKDLHFTSWLTRMKIERLEHKTRRIESLFEECQGDYAKVAYMLLLSNFGFKINAIPFELVARHLPLQILLRHRDQVQQLEALLLGTAGMLEEQLSDPYLRCLQNEYLFLRNKYKLFPLDKSIFKFSRMRPANFPALRLAQFAAFVHKDARLLISPVEEKNAEVLKSMLSGRLSPYWQKHYTTNGDKAEIELHLGNESVANIILNTIAPFFFFFGNKTGSGKHKEIALELLDQCAAENNFKTRLFRIKKHLIRNAGDTQGLINLFDNYCSNKRCLACGIGTQILGSNVKTKDTPPVEGLASPA